MHSPATTPVVRLPFSVYMNLKADPFALTFACSFSFSLPAPPASVRSSSRATHLPVRWTSSTCAAGRAGKQAAGSACYASSSSGRQAKG